MKFRKDINGLRAIAVIAVVFFHFNPKWVPGGFAGVDVFFVISGFLMTSIIFKGLDENNFNLLRFYIARAKRIIPVLSVLCASLLIIGWFLFTPLDYALLGKHVASSIGFISNMVYLKESGYFDAASIDKWLLHTWSLSVEWQFYMAYPLVLLLLKRKIGLKPIRHWILIGTVISFFYCLFSTFFWPSAAFYLLPSRAWEMMFGGVVYLYPVGLKNNFKRVMEWAGVALILSAYFLLSKTSLWPGYYSLVPVFGAMLILWSKRQNSFLTNNYLFQSIGSASYSIYLWHWPIVVCFNYLELYQLKFQQIGIGLSFILGWLSYYFIEKRLVFSAPKISVIKVATYPPIIFVFILGTLGSILYLEKGIASRLNNSTLENIVRSPKAFLCSGKVKNTCNYFFDNTQWATVGNSHSIEISYALALKLKEQKLGIRQFSLSACTMAYKRTLDDACVKWTNDVVNEIINDKKIKHVVIAYRYTSSLFGSNIQSYPALPDEHPELAEHLSKSEGRKKILQSLLLMIRDLAQKKETVFVMLPIPELGININKIAFQNRILGNKISSLPGTTTSYTLERNKLVRDTLFSEILPKNVFLVDPMKVYCDQEICYSFINGTPLYYDDDHPSLKGAQMLVNELFNRTLSDIASYTIN